MPEPVVRTAHYTALDGRPLDITYDAMAPCIQCGLPVVEASMGGTTVCPWCDCGVYRDGTRHDATASSMTFRSMAHHLAGNDTDWHALALAMRDVAETEECPSPMGEHFWSEPTATGHIVCLWCKRRKVATGA